MIISTISTISIATTRAPLPRMVSVVEVTSYLAQRALRMKLLPMMLVVTMKTLIMMRMVKMIMRRKIMNMMIVVCSL